MVGGSSGGGGSSSSSSKSSSNGRVRAGSLEEYTWARSADLIEVRGR